MSNQKTKEKKNNLTGVKDSRDGDVTSCTYTTNTITVDKEDKNTAEIKSSKECEKPSKFDKLVERYMKCEKRTLAEMLAMHDTENDDWAKDFDFKEKLQKILNDPNTFKVPMDPIPPVQPNSPYIPPYPNYDAYCFNAPGNRCVKGNAVYLGKCDGCPYLYMSWSPKITWRTDSNQENSRKEYEYGIVK